MTQAGQTATLGRTSARLAGAEAARPPVPYRIAGAAPMIADSRKPE
jgi:hypothetical protein